MGLGVINGVGFRVKKFEKRRKFAHGLVGGVSWAAHLRDVLFVIVIDLIVKCFEFGLALG